MCGVQIDGVEDIMDVTELLKRHERTYDAERANASILNKADFLGKEDIVWVIGPGVIGDETAVYGEFAKKSIGIDPVFPNNETIGNCHYLGHTIEEVLRFDSIPKPTMVISNSFFGISSVLPDILAMDTNPSCLINPCDCKKCIELYYADSKPKSVFFQESYPGGLMLNFLAAIRHMLM